MPYRITTLPAAYPVSLQEAKVHLRVTSADDDELILALIGTAAEKASAYTGRAMLVSTVEQVWDCFPQCGEITLRMAPVSGTPVVTYIDANGVEQTLSSSAYHLDTVSEPARLVRADSASWPSTRRQPNAVKVTYSAGYSSAAFVPAPIRQAMLLIIGYLYENREDSPIKDTADMPRASKWLLDPYRLYF